jgi:two-component system sensor histidine kinase YesM
MSVQTITKLDDHIKNMDNISKILLLKDEDNKYRTTYEKLDNSNHTGILDIGFTKSFNQETFSIMFFNPSVHSICAFNLKGAGGYSVQNGVLYLPNLKPANTEWFNKSLEKRGASIYLSTFDLASSMDPGRRIYVFSVARAVMKIEENKAIGVILVNSGIDFIDKVVKEMLMVPNQKSIIVDQEGRVVYDAYRKNITEEFDFELLNKLDQNDGVLKDIKIDGMDCLVTSKVSELTGWKLINIIRMGELNKNINQMAAATAVITIVMVFIALIFILLFSFRITRPMKKLMLLMNLLEKGDFDVKVRITGRNEIGKLARTFNNMTRKVKKLINDVYIEKINQRELELQMLKNQINPHFLYNTLESMRMVAEYNNIPKVSDMAFLLGKILRFGINTNKEIVTVKEEIEYLGYYVKLQNYRFGNSFEAVINIDESIEDCLIIKLILQPLAENAIYHGLAGRSQGGLIEVTGITEAENILFTISDNGQGMDEETLYNLNGYLQGLNNNFKSIGLKNVHKRIQLYYGNDYGIKIESIQGSGTSVKVMLPKVFA